MYELFKKLELSDFNDRFSNEEACLEALAAQKWSDGFVCRKCGHGHYCQGRTPFSRRCTRCKQEESAKAHTVFHHCRIPLTQAFELAYRVCVDPKVSSYELGRKLNLRQMTCWKFKKKITECIENRENFSRIEAERLKELMSG